MTQPLQQPERNPFDDAAFVLTAGIVMAAVFGTFLTLAGMFYIKDMTTFQQLPDIIWSFVCGIPTDNDVALPLLMTLGIVAFGVSGALGVWRWWITREKRKNDALS